MTNPKLTPHVLGRNGQSKPLVAPRATTPSDDHPALDAQAAIAAVVLETAQDVRTFLPNRMPTDVLLHLFSEFGELAEEVTIADGGSYKAQGADGVVGEAIDVILCAVDLVYVLSQTIQQPIPTSAFQTIADPQPPRHGKTTSPMSLTMGMLHPIGLAEFLLGEPRRTKTQRESVMRGVSIATTQLASLCLRAAVAADPTLTGDDLVAVAKRKCAKWRAAYTPTTGA